MRISDWSSDVCSSDLHPSVPRQPQGQFHWGRNCAAPPLPTPESARPRSEEHTSELQSLMRISYAVFCLKKKTKKTTNSTRSIVIKWERIQHKINCLRDRYTKQK